MADKTVSDWTVADLGAYLREAGATLTVRTPAAGPTTASQRAFDVSIFTMHGCVMVSAPSLVDALAEAVRKHDVVRS